jgi:hypothetical protein
MSPNMLPWEIADPVESSVTRAARTVLIAGALALLATGCSGGGKNGSAPQSGLKVGNLTLAAPAGWKVNKDMFPDSFRVVVSGTCKADDDIANQNGCPGFQVLGASYVTPDEQNGPPVSPYDPAETHAGQFVQDAGYNCPADPKLRGTGKAQGAKLVKQATATVGGRTAEYREWRIACYTRGPEVGEPLKKTGTVYTERDWYLAAAKILIVDEWNTPGLDQLLAKATWK